MSRKVIQFTLSPSRSLLTSGVVDIFRCVRHSFFTPVETQHDFTFKIEATAVWNSFSDSHIRFIQAAVVLVPIYRFARLYLSLLLRVCRSSIFATGRYLAKSVRPTIPTAIPAQGV